MLDVTLRATQSRHAVARGERRFTAVFKPPYARIHAAIFFQMNLVYSSIASISLEFFGLLIDDETRLHCNFLNSDTNGNGILLKFD